jgi:arylsulfatase A-like enzyme
VRLRVAALLLLLLSLPPAPAATAPPPRPNFVIILADDLGYGDIGPFGSKLNRTPRLDRMASEGMRLTSFYGAPVCTPSRAQILSGCYAKRVSLPNVIFPACPIGLNTNEATLPKLLKQQGYATMAIGKWHLGDQREFLPTRHGFGHYLGLPYSNDMGPAEERAVLRALEKAARNEPTRLGKPGALGITSGARPPLPLVRDEEVIENISAPQQDFLTARYAAEAVQFIQEHRAQPFFLYLAHTAVHVPLHPGPDFRGKSKNGLYGDWVEEVDWSVGRVLDTLRELELDRKTLVVFTSDNGPWLVMGTNGGIAGPLRGGKGSTWEGGVREPTVARWPGQIAAGTTGDAIMANFDFLPTFVGLAGGTLPATRKLDGADLWPLLSGQSQAQAHKAFWYFNGNRLEAVRSGPWKLSLPGQGGGNSGKKVPSETPSKTTRLYNLDTDIGESTDVARQHPEVVERLERLVADMNSDLGKSRPGPGVRPPGRVASPQPMMLPGTRFVMEAAPATAPPKK